MADAHNSGDLPPRHDSDNGVSGCGDSAVRILRYLDNDLKDLELAEIRAHLTTCANCRENLEAEQAFSGLLHRTRPLYSAPDALRAQMSAVSNRHPVPTVAAAAPYQRVFQFLRGQLPGIGQRVPGLRALAPALLIVAVCLAFVPSFVRYVQAGTYAQTAVADHRNYLNGNLRMGIESGSPQAVTAWFAGKVPFDFRLPAAESVPEDKPTYKLTGAALVSYKGAPAALVTYESLAGRISLLVASTNAAVVAGGEEVQLGKLTFHYRSDDGYRMITWSNHGLAYALVSSVAGSAQESCLVCHQSMADRSDFKPRR